MSPNVATDWVQLVNTVCLYIVYQSSLQGAHKLSTHAPTCKTHEFANCDLQAVLYCDLQAVLCVAFAVRVVYVVRCALCVVCCVLCVVCCVLCAVRCVLLLFSTLLELCVLRV